MTPVSAEILRVEAACAEADCEIRAGVAPTGPQDPGRTKRLGRRVAFVEPKTLNWRRMEALCAASAASGHWTNFGPVGDRLAALLREVMAVPASHLVTPASSATTALQAIVGAHVWQAGRPLTWAVSAFGFYSSVIGPLTGQFRLVDCDHTGMLALGRLAELDVGAWDGLIVTNVFGIAADLGAYADLCRRQGKPMVVDSALGFPLPRHQALGADEVVSFHHTKPWGFGEGGCAIVAAERAGVVRSLLNFGSDADPALSAFATNGKMSDLAAAAIVERVERMASWSALYAAQRRRIAGLIADAGFALLGCAPETVISGHLPLLLPSPVALDQLPPARFDIGRYYRPLAPGFACAADLYGRMINIPCHAAMEAIPPSEIAHYLARLKSC
jgi:dTDP-4-amino-4,6-dideoxygalactose transaminase